MVTFDFITDEAFRAAMEADRQEMRKCSESGAWKAVHVLAGSVIEAVLIDYLIVEGHLDREVGLRADLGKAIELAKKHGIISERSGALSTVVKDYRNLIHPGRSIRSNERVSENSARIAWSLLEMILEEIDGRKRTNYGYTAEQIATKIERDSSARAILPHLLKEINGAEVERLLIKVVPDRYFTMLLVEEQFSPSDHISAGLIALFRGAFECASEQVKAKVAKRFVTILKEEADTIVLAYGTAFFRLSDLTYLSVADRALVKGHYFGRLKDHVSDELLTALEGMGAFLEEAEIPRFVDPLVRVILSKQPAGLKRHASDRLKEEHVHMDGTNLVQRLDEWIRRYRSKGNEEQARAIEDVRLGIDIPF